MRNCNILLLFCLLCLFIGCKSVPKAKTTGIVIVGMENSAKYGKCEGAEQDAATMNEILSKYGFPTILLNGHASRSAVINALKNASQNDLMIFFYSGHGGSGKIGDISDEADEKNEYLCLNDGYLLDNDIWNIVCQAKGRVMLIFDCCHSETMFRTSGMDIEKMLWKDASILPRLSLGNVQLLCWSGCADSTYSYGDKNGGLLTNAIKHSYHKNYTYSKMWNNIAFKMPNYQIPKITEIGGGFNGKVFQ